MTDDPRQCRFCSSILKDYRGRVAHEAISHPDQYRDKVDEAQVCEEYTNGVPVHEIRTRHRIAHKRMYAILETHGIPRRQRPKAEPVERPEPKQRPRNPPMVKRYPRGGVMPWRELLA